MKSTVKIRLLSFLAVALLGFVLATALACSRSTEKAGGGGGEAPKVKLILNWVPGFIWLGLKTWFVVTLFIWARASFPRYRYDQIMRLGWKVFIPLTLIWLVLVAGWMQTPWNIWK